MNRADPTGGSFLFAAGEGNRRNALTQRAGSGKDTTRRASGDRGSSVTAQDVAVFPGSGKGPIDVCLFCVHPLLSTEFRRVLADTHFRATYQRVEAGRVPSPEQWSIPPASVHVVEAHSNGQATMGIIRRVLSEGPGARVLVVREEFPEREAYPLLSTGARGLLQYSEVESQLARALGVIAAGGFWVPRLLLSGFVDSVLTSRPVRSGPLAQGLSRREAEVLELLLRNLSNKEIAKELAISSRTAKFHVSNLLAKHGVQRRADLILLAHAARPV